MDDHSLNSSSDHHSTDQESEKHMEEEYVPRKTIGSMNGMWGIAFKVALATYPFFLTWAIWMTHETMTNKYFREAGNIVTQKELKQSEFDIKEDIRTNLKIIHDSFHTAINRLDDRIDEQPPEQWQQRIVQTEKDSQTTKVNIVEIRSDINYIRKALEKLE